MPRLWANVAFRLALCYGLLVVGSMTLISTAFYFGTVGVLAGSINAKLEAASARLVRQFDDRGLGYLGSEIQQLLTDGIDQDTEVYLLLGPEGRKLAGNIEGWTTLAAPLDQLTDVRVVRYGRESLSRVLPHRLSDGSMLLVGRDMQDQRAIERLVWHSLILGGAAALILAISGALLFRRQLERRVGAIRRTAAEVMAGDLSRRIPVLGGEDEFARLNRDINDMLDRIQHLMHGVRHVSNAIAHDLRTPLGRIRSRLDKTLRSNRTAEGLAETAEFAIEQIDQLIQLLDRLLQIAEAEARAGTQSFVPLAVAPILTDVVELYDALAELENIALAIEVNGAFAVYGDRILLTNAVANLVDNALKYAGRGATVQVTATAAGDLVSITVADNGPGIPEAERPHVTERFYRLDKSRGMPGHGLGLSIVTAVATLHRGWLVLEDASPGLAARLVLPRANDRPAAVSNLLSVPELGLVPSD